MENMQDEKMKVEINDETMDEMKSENTKDEVDAKVSESGDSMSIPHDGGVVLIPKPSDDPNDPLVCIAAAGLFFLSIMHKSQDTNQPFSAELETSKEG